MKKRQFVVTSLFVFLLGISTAIYTKASSATVSTVSSQNSTGIIQSSDGNIVIDAEDITNLRKALNNNAAVLTSYQESANDTAAAITDSLADAWAAGIYYAGEYVIYNNTLYRCIADTSRTDGSPSEDTAHWEVKKVADILEYTDDFSMSISESNGQYVFTVTKMD